MQGALIMGVWFEMGSLIPIMPYLFLPVRHDRYQGADPERDAHNSGPCAREPSECSAVRPSSFSTMVFRRTSGCCARVGASRPRGSRWRLVLFQHEGNVFLCLAGASATSSRSPTIWAAKISR